MAGANITYKVVGRYMNGKEVVGYHFIGSDNSPLALNKERTIYLIGKGVIENMRISTNNGEIIIRGKGINLNTLPVYDESKDKYRPGQVSQQAAASSAQARGVDNRNNMSNFKIVKRIMKGTNCIGYVLEDIVGNLRNVSRDTVIEYAKNNRISNAILNKVTDPSTGQLTFALRGVNGCQFKKLPIMIVDEAGRIIDPKSNKSLTTIRAARMKSAGHILNRTNGRVDRFTVGDFVVINVDGHLKVVPGQTFITEYVPEKGQKTATCDHCLNCLSDYTLEIYGSSSMVINPNQALTWAMARHI